MLPFPGSVRSTSIDPQSTAVGLPAPDPNGPEDGGAPLALGLLGALPHCRRRRRRVLRRDAPTACVPARRVRPRSGPQPRVELEAVTTDARCRRTPGAVPCASCCRPSSARRAPSCAAPGPGRCRARSTGTGWARSPASTRPAGAPAPGRWSSRRACCGPGDAKRLDGLTDSKLLTAGGPRGVLRAAHARARDHAVVVVPTRGGRPPRRARGQHRGHAAGGGPAVRPPRLRADRRFPGARLRQPGARRAQGRPGGGLRGRGVGAGQGHPGPDHGRAGRRVPAVRVRRAQGLLHAGARRRAGRARAQPGAPVLVRQRAGRRGTGARCATPSCR